MKHVTLVLLFLHCIGAGIKAQSVNKALFLGNSYTGVNNLPQLVHDVALSAGDTLVFDSYTPGGYRLIDHSTDPNSQGKIMAGGWDYVVLQGQSQESIVKNHEFRNGASGLNKLISQYIPCAVVKLYMTWGRKNGDPSNCASFPVMCTYEGMDSTTRNNYIDLGAGMHAEISPVSVVWYYLRQNHPGIELYQTDGSHPSKAGSYAAACCFYTTIFQKDPTLITFDFGLSATDAAFIRNAAKTAVFKNLNQWDFKQPPVSDFRYEIGTGVNEVLFFNRSGHEESYFWDFGDGTTSSLPSPTHSYAANGTYKVVSTTTKCDQQGWHTSMSDTIIEFCSHTPTIYTSQPWLCQFDTLWTQPAQAYQWYYYELALPETKQYLADYAQYNGTSFTVKTTINGCTELSKIYSGSVEWSGYYFDILPGADPCEGDTVSFTVLYSGGPFTGTEIIQWYKDGILLPMMTNEDTLFITEPGTYECKVVDPNAKCPTDTTAYQIVFDCGTTGFNNHSDDLSWHLYPNPASESITIQFTNEFQKEMIEIYNATGRLVRVKKVISTTEVNVADLPDGLYFVRLRHHREPALKFVKY